ncbi:MAG: hypothetical protein DHS20C06_10420 [Hyphobacterium sp.]|nr:MAG: hypothetical protein DHS20C06_10420 [Hyphobacterium sp.]
MNFTISDFDRDRFKRVPGRAARTRAAQNVKRRTVDRTQNVFAFVQKDTTIRQRQCSPGMGTYVQETSHFFSFADKEKRRAWPISDAPTLLW